MTRSIIGAFTLILLLADSSRAANFAALVQPPTLISVIILIVAIACLIFCLQVMSLVRGGYFSRSWKLFMVGFGALALAQLGIALNNTEMLIIPDWISPALLIAMSASFLFGLLETRKTLS